MKSVCYIYEIIWYKIHENAQNIFCIFLNNLFWNFRVSRFQMKKNWFTLIIGSFYAVDWLTQFLFVCFTSFTSFTSFTLYRRAFLDFQSTFFYYERVLVNRVYIYVYIINNAFGRMFNKQRCLRLDARRNVALITTISVWRVNHKYGKYERAILIVMSRTFRVLYIYYYRYYYV